MSFHRVLEYREYNRMYSVHIDIKTQGFFMQRYRVIEWERSNNIYLYGKKTSGYIALKLSEEIYDYTPKEALRSYKGRISLINLFN